MDVELNLGILEINRMVFGTCFSNWMCGTTIIGSIKYFLSFALVVHFSMLRVGASLCVDALIHWECENTMMCSMYSFYQYFI